MSSSPFFISLTEMKERHFFPLIIKGGVSWMFVVSLSSVRCHCNLLSVLQVSPCHIKDYEVVVFWRALHPLARGCTCIL